MMWFTGSKNTQIHSKLCDLVSGTPLGEILMNIDDGSHCEKLYHHYINDFVHSVHKCTHELEEAVKNEYQVHTTNTHTTMCTDTHTYTHS